MGLKPSKKGKKHSEATCLKRMGFPFGIETTTDKKGKRIAYRGLKRMGFPFGIETLVYVATHWHDFIV